MNVSSTQKVPVFPFDAQLRDSPLFQSEYVHIKGVYEMQSKLKANDQIIGTDIFNSDDIDFFDSMTEFISSVLNLPIAGICLAHDKHFSLLGQSGLEGVQKFDREDSFCHFTLSQNECFIVEDTTDDYRFKDSSLVNTFPFLKFYAGVPLFLGSSGRVGTLFVASHETEAFSQEQEYLLTTFSKQVQSNLVDKVLKNTLIARDANNLENLKFFVHDLKNPISIIKISLDLLNKETLENSKEDKIFERCQRNLKKVYCMIDELLTSKPVTLHSLEACSSIISIKDTISQAVFNMQYLITETQKIKTDIKDCSLHSDKVLLERILENLISNAIKYGKGSDILIESKVATDHIEISISDEGMGIRDDYKEKVFDFGFKKGYSSFPSHGIGLNFCKTTANLIGGDLCVIDNKPVGATFVLKIPL